MDILGPAAPQRQRNTATLPHVRLLRHRHPHDARLRRRAAHKSGPCFLLDSIALIFVVICTIWIQPLILLSKITIQPRCSRPFELSFSGAPCSPRQTHPRAGRARPLLPQKVTQTVSRPSQCFDPSRLKGGRPPCRSSAASRRPSPSPAPSASPSSSATSATSCPRATRSRCARRQRRRRSDRNHGDSRRRRRRRRRWSSR